MLKSHLEQCSPSWQRSYFGLPGSVATITAGRCVCVLSRKIQWFHALKCWNAFLNSGLTLDEDSVFANLILSPQNMTEKSPNVVKPSSGFTRFEQRSLALQLSPPSLLCPPDMKKSKFYSGRLVGGWGEVLTWNHRNTLMLSGKEKTELKAEKKMRD